MPEAGRIGAVDCWINPLTPEVASSPQPEFLVRVATDYFHRADELQRGTPFDAMVSQMDEAGVEAGILTIDAHNPAPFAERPRLHSHPSITARIMSPVPCD